MRRSKREEQKTGLWSDKKKINGRREKKFTALLKLNFQIKNKLLKKVPILGTSWESSLNQGANLNKN